MGLYDKRLGSSNIDKGGTVYNVKHPDFAGGAKGDGVTNDRAAFVAVETFIDANLESDKSGYVPTGLYVIGSNLTLAKSWEFAYGAQIQPANGVTVTFNGPFAAGIYQVFDTSAGGTIAFGINSVDGTSPQWWGAVANAIPSSANHTAIRAAIVAAQGAGVPTRVPSGRIDTTAEINPPPLELDLHLWAGLASLRDSPVNIY